MPNRKRTEIDRTLGAKSNLASGASVRYGLLCLMLACQLATIVITWTIWNVRAEPVLLPLLPLPQFSFGILMVVSLLPPLVWPRAGVIAHAVVFAAACLWDQYRMQPQVISLVVLMFACTADLGTWFARWYLASMWLWSGLHKALSPEWWGGGAWTFLNECGIPADDLHLYFAALVAASEIGLGLLAIFAPGPAAICCVLLHLGILLSLSPLMRNFNASVWPWNLATAVAGAWILRQKIPLPGVERPAVRWAGVAMVAALFLIPAGWYFNLVNPHLAFVLYSGHLPRAYHTTPQITKRIDGWGGMNAPFPDSPRLFVQAFRQTAAPGDKLFVGDPRWGLSNRYFVKSADGTVLEITRERFVRAESSQEVVGIEVSDPSVVWRLQRAGVRIEKDQWDLLSSATLAGPAFTNETLARLGKLPNLRQLHLEDAAITDAGLLTLQSWPRLETLYIKRCPISDQALSHLARCAQLKKLHLEEVTITSAGLHALGEFPQLQVLQLPKARLDDHALDRLGSLANLAKLDLSGATVTPKGLKHLSRLSQCRWLGLADTQIGNLDLVHLSELARLEIVELARTRVGDDGLLHLSKLTECQHLDLEGTEITDDGLEHLAALTELRYLSVRGTNVTPAGVSQLKTRLPLCQIED